MAPLPPPHGMSEVDYEAIEAAVTETVRGRWFLNEFARRNRTLELRQLLEAMSRLEHAVAAGPALPPADPSIRLMMQRIKEIARQLQTLAADMRVSGVDEHFATGVENEARAVAGMMRGPSPALLPAAEKVAPAGVAKPLVQMEAAAVGERPPGATQHQPVAGVAALRANASAAASGVSDDPRLTALSGIDGLTFAEKLALFS